MHQHILAAQQKLKSLQLRDAYYHLRRFYDRLPFEPTPEHAYFVGSYVRILRELGKEREAEFHERLLEELYPESKTSGLAYQLAFFHAWGSEEKRARALALLDDVIRDPKAMLFRTKAKLLLAWLLDGMDRFGEARYLVEREGRSGDPEVDQLLTIWRARIDREESRFDTASERLRRLLGTISPERDWYCYAQAKRQYVCLLWRRGHSDHAEIELSDLKRWLKSKHLRYAQHELSSLERLM